MAIPLLSTKLFIPPPVKSLVVRPRLLEKLDESLQPGCRLTLVSAPAGFGKTTLVSTWASGLKSPDRHPSPSVAWLSLEARDNNPILFWSYVISALQTQQAGLGQQALSLLQAAPPPSQEAFLELLINELTCLPDPFILLLDDYHLIRSPAIHDALSFFVGHIPSQFHTILSSRTDPSLPLALMRGRSQLLEIRLADLRFTADETASFLNQVMQLDLTEKEVDALSRRTEGWIVGLQMAALSLEKEGDRRAFIAAFNGNDRYIADYLIDEVLQRQTEEVQRFLLQTSILDHLHAPLCDAVTGLQSSQKILDLIEKANLFIVPLDHQGEWFRYHQLFAELLLHRLLQSEGEERIQILQRHAVDWLVKNGYIKLAAEYAIKYADYELASSLMTSGGSQFLKDNEFSTLLLLAEHLPDELISQNIRLTIMLAHSANATGHIQKAEQLIRNAEKQIGVTIDEFIQKGDSLELSPLVKAGLIELGVINARTCVDTFHLKRTFYLSEHLLPYLTEERDREVFALNQPSNLRGSLLFTCGLAQKLHGNVAQAAQSFVESAREGKRTRNLHIEILSMGHLGDAQALEGRLREAYKTFQQTLAAPAEFLQKTPFFGLSKAGLGNLAYEWNELEKAEEYFKAAIEHGMWWRNWENLMPGHIGLARLHASRGDWNAAYKDLDDLLKNTQEKEGIVQTRVGSLRALLDLRTGDLESAERWAEAYEPERPCDFIVEWEQDALVGCRVWMAHGQAERAARLLERITTEAGAAGRNAQVLEALCVRSILFASIHREADALSALAKALEMAKPENFVRTFVDEGKPMAELLALAIKKGIQPEYASHLLEAFQTTRSGEIPGPNAGGVLSSGKGRLAASLSERELKVIALIAEGYSNKEIAQKLDISVRTVKYYITGIFTKLEVDGRAHAAVKAKELGLLK